MADTDRTAYLTTYRQHRFTRPPGACDVLLVRHGESAAARADASAPIVDGQSDPPLDPRGRDEAARVADRLAGEGVGAIYVSTLRRTHETAAPLAARLGVAPRVEPDLREVFLGEWEGVAFRRGVAERDPLAVRVLREQRWDVLPGAERNEDLAARVRGALERIAAAHADERVVVVTHGGVIATAVHLATGSQPFAFLGVDNASLTHLVVTPQRWIVRRYNDTGHLDTDLDRPVEPLT